MTVRPLILFLSFSLLMCGAKAQEDRLDAAAFLERMKDKNAQLVDVRTPEEFAKGHLPGAVNIDWLEEGFLERAAVLEKARPVLLYCAAGGRSEEALAAMKKAGYTDSVDLLNGFNGWKRNNLPVETK